MPNNLLNLDKGLKMAIKAPFLRTPYNYDTNAASNESGLHCEDATLTQQHYKDETDINNILRQFNITGLLPENTLSPRYGDFSGISDYQSALNAVIAAESDFELINFLENDQNYDEAVKLGLVNQKTEASVQPVKAESTSEKTAE